MRKALFYNPRLLGERLGMESRRDGVGWPNCAARFQANLTGILSIDVHKMAFGCKDTPRQCILAN